MPADFAHLTWILALTWFILFWVVGGMLFAVVALTRFLKVKKAQFSCLFTLASVAAAYGAATTGMMTGEPRALRCIGGAAGAFDIGKAFVDCSLREIFLAGSAWFALLILVSILLMLLSQREAKPLTHRQ